MKHNGLARFHRMDAPQQILRGHAFEHRRRGEFIADAVRQIHHFFGGDIVGFGISADGAAAITYPLADLNAGDAVAQRIHHAGGFRAQAGRQRQRIKAGAMIGVDEVHADGSVLDPDLARARRRQIVIHILQNFSAAGLFEANGFDHDCSSIRDALMLRRAQHEELVISSP